MKNNISITIESDLLEEVKKAFPDKKRSQVVEEALLFWTAKKRKIQLKKDAEKLKSFFDESASIESETINDGLNGV